MSANQSRKRSFRRGEAMILALELAEEIVAVAALMAEHIRDTVELDRRSVGAVARQLKRTGDQIIEQLADGIGK